MTKLMEALVLNLVEFLDSKTLIGVTFFGSPYISHVSTINGIKTISPIASLNATSSP